MPEAVLGEAGREMADGVRRDRLRAIGDHAQGAEIEAGDRLVIDLAGKARSRNSARPTGSRDGDGWPTATLWPHQERERRHDDERRGEIEAAEPGADQSHVVVERQPAHEDIGRARLHRSPMARIFASRLPWLRTTPLGSPVLPEVY